VVPFPTVGSAMSRFSTLKLSTKLSLLVAVFSVGFIAFTLVAWATIARVKVNGPLYHEITLGKDLIADVLPPPEYLVESYLVVLDLVDGTADQAEALELIERGKKLRQEYEQRHAFWTSEIPQGAINQALLVRSYAPAIEFFDVRDKEVIPALHSGNLEKARSLAHGLLKQRYEEHRRAIDEVVRLTNAQNSSVEARATEFVSTSTASLFGIAAVILSLAFWLAWLIVSSLVARLQRSSIALMSTATEIAATSREQQATVNSYTTSTTEIAAAVKEISATSQELQSTLEEISTTAMNAASLAQSGRSGIDDMDETMAQLSGATGSVSAKLSVIREKAGDINLVVTTITKVADQTNLLSVNAAIEAEKAGEYGLGFLVVAREIRRLADQSAIATLDIEQMVRQMQGAVSAGVMEMDQFTEQVRRGVQAVAHIGGQLSQIIERVEGLSGRIASLNEGMRSQSLGASQISEAMTQLTDGARQTSASLKEFNSATESLRDVVVVLRQELSASANAA
jgi:methyl-accepting chemotaxis protein WspA